ncbi:MAG: hypothetical protein AAF213_05645 [Pseudomonadota bacterium]
MPKRTVTLELNDDVLRAARRQALEETRQLADYIEELIKRDLGLPLSEDISVINAAGVDQFVPEREVGETRSEYKKRKDIADYMSEHLGGDNS